MHAYYIILSKKFPRLKILLALHRPLELLLNIKGPRDQNYIENELYSYALWCGT